MTGSSPPARADAGEDARGELVLPSPSSSPFLTLRPCLSPLAPLAPVLDDFRLGRDLGLPSMLPRLRVVRSIPLSSSAPSSSVVPSVSVVSPSDKSAPSLSLADDGDDEVSLPFSAGLVEVVDVDVSDILLPSVGLGCCALSP